MEFDYWLKVVVVITIVILLVVRQIQMQNQIDVLDERLDYHSQTILLLHDEIIKLKHQTRE